MIYVFDHDLKGAKTQKIWESALHSVCTSSIPNCNTDGLVATLFQKKPECSKGDRRGWEERHARAVCGSHTSAFELRLQLQITSSTVDTRWRMQSTPPFRL